MTALTNSVRLALFAVVLLACSEEAQERREISAAAAPPQQVSDLPRSPLTERVPDARVVYVPAYSRIFTDVDRVTELAVSLSVRNTDDRHPIRITSIRYYDSGGNLVADYLDGVSAELARMATATQPVSLVDRRGGEGANFIVEWTSAVPVSDPIIEAVMISGGMQGISFTSRGIEIERR